MKLKLLFLLLISPIIVSSQSNIETYKISYNSEGINYSLYYQDDIMFLSKADASIKQYANFKEQTNFSVINSNDSLFRLATKFSDLPKTVKIEEKTKVKILGYKCKYAEYSYFSNKVELWYTEDAKAKGSLFSRFLPSENALILKIKVNGSLRLTATAIEKIDTLQFDYLADNATEVSDAKFEELKINSRFTVLNIFDDETINWDTSITTPRFDEIENDVVYHFSNGTVLLKKIKLNEDLKSNNRVFAKLNCRSNGDAYDRTGSVFIVPANKQLSVINAFIDSVQLLPSYTDNNGGHYNGIRLEDNYEPAIEAMRFFTSFGVNYFNEKRPINNYPWANDVVYKQEISSLIPNTEDEIWVGVFIGNYDKGGHKISLEFDIYPAFDVIPIDQKTYVQPLFSTVNILEGTGQNYGRLFNNDTLEIDFTVPDNIDDLKLLFTTTGHGGWGEGDEFVPKLNTILLDGKPIFSIMPWRTDCATYRFSNPASGNFGNGMSSSDLSRSNWCPATLTPPYVIPLSQLKEGIHKLKVIIDQGQDTESGYSHWQVSGVLTGNTK